MRWSIIVLLGLVLLATGCGGGASDGDGGAPEQGAAADLADPVRDAFEAQLESALLRDLPLLDEEEARCISDAVLAIMPDFDTAADANPAHIAEEMVAGVQAAQERCLTKDRMLELEASVAAVRTPEPEERAFLLAVRGAVEGLDTEDEELVGGGRLVCGLAEGAGSLEKLLAQLAATPETSASVAADLSPSLGRVLEAEELITFSTMAVATLCPEFDEG